MRVHQRRRGNHLRISTTCAALLATCALRAGPLGAQAVLDWPLVLEARPAALVTGAGGVLGNPAGVARLDARAEALVSDLETPEAIGLRGLSIAGAVELFGGWSLAAAYRHVGVGDMLRTDGPPLGSGNAPTPTFEVAEDAYALGVAFERAGFSAGAAGRVDTPEDDLGGDATWSGSLGALFVTKVPFADLSLGGSLEMDEDDPGFTAGAEAGAPLLLDARLRLALAYGARLDGQLGTEHSIVASGGWRGIAELQLGASAQPEAGDASEWVPLFAGLVHLGRYHLGIVREHLPNGFGAAMHYRLSVAF